MHNQATRAPPPPTRSDDVVETIFGRTIRDPYRWLEDESSPEVQAWMRAQDAYARALLAKLPRRAELAVRLRELMYCEKFSPPVDRGGRQFYTRQAADADRSVLYWKQPDKGLEHVLLDPNQLAADGSKSLAGWWPSWNGRFVAFAISEHNSDETVIRVRDVATNLDLAETVTGTKYSAASWDPLSAGFYYSWTPPISAKVTPAEQPGLTVLRYHALRTRAADDPIVREPTRDPRAGLSGSLSRDGHWLFATIDHGWASTEIHVRDARKPGSQWQPLVVGIDAIFSVIAWRDRFYVRTNDGAPRYRIFEVDPSRPARADWKEIVRESDATLESVTIIGDRLVLSYLRDASHRIEIRDLRGASPRQLTLPGDGTIDAITGDPDAEIAYFSFNSFTIPHVILKSTIKTGESEPWARSNAPFDPAAIAVDRVVYTSKDGTRVPMFVLHRKDVTPNHKRPTLLYGYGGFNVSVTPVFSSMVIAWLELGGVYALPNLRGGGEFGESWHRGGMLENKQNVFDDFVAAAEYLIGSGWTSTQHLAITGGSNGGLLIGAVVTQRPELFGAVVCAVPLLDMLRYHKVGWGMTWVGEYGSPDDRAQAGALWAYSPYRVAIDAGRRSYPPILIESADHDDRVDPMHARKFAAALQSLQTNDGPTLLRIERNSGHTGADSTAADVALAVDEFAFLLDRIGTTQTP